MSVYHRPFDQARASQILRAILLAGLTRDQMSYLTSEEVEFCGARREAAFDEEIWTLTDRAYGDEDVPDSIDLLSMSDWDYWHAHVRGEDVS